MHRFAHSRRYEPSRSRVGGAAAALVMTAVVAMLLVVAPATITPGDADTTMLATLGHAARTAFGLL